MAKKIVKKSKKTCGSKKSGCKKSCVKNTTPQSVEQEVVSLPLNGEPVSLFGKIKSFFGL